MKSSLKLSLETLHKIQEWKGSAAQLADHGSNVLASSSDTAMNERLVRDYVTRKILRKPNHEGRKAIFGFYQLLQFVAARVLLTKGGWPLGKIAQFVGAAGHGDLLGIIEHHVDPRVSVAVANAIASQTGSSAELLDHAPSVRANSFEAHAAKQVRGTQELDLLRTELGASDDLLLIEALTRVTVARGLYMDVANSRLRQMTEEDAVRIGIAIELALKEMIIPRNQSITPHLKKVQESDVRTTN